MGDYILYKNLAGKYLTLNDCLEENKEKHENTIFYVTNEKEQSQYINLFKEEGIDAVIMPAAIDNPFISHVEQKHEGLKFPVSYTHLAIQIRLKLTYRVRITML